MVTILFAVGSIIAFRFRSRAALELKLIACPWRIRKSSQNGSRGQSCEISSTSC